MWLDWKFSVWLMCKRSEQFQRHVVRTYLLWIILRVRKIPATDFRRYASSIATFSSLYLTLHSGETPPPPPPRSLVSHTVFHAVENYRTIMKRLGSMCCMKDSDTPSFLLSVYGARLHRWNLCGNRRMHTDEIVSRIWRYSLSGK